MQADQTCQMKVPRRGTARQDPKHRKRAADSLTDRPDQVVGKTSFGNRAFTAATEASQSAISHSPRCHLKNTGSASSARFAHFGEDCVHFSSPFLLSRS